MNDIMQFLVAHGELVLFVVVLLEQLGLPLPSLIFLIAAGTLVGTGQLDIYRVIGLSFVACLLADAIWFELGRKYGTRVLALLCRVSFEPDTCVRLSERMINRHGLRSLLIAKFIPGLSTIAPPLAGVFRLGLYRFLLFDGIGALIWVSAGVGVGYALSNQFEVVANFVTQMGLTIVLVMAGVIAVYVAVKLGYRQWVLRRLRIGRITVEELDGLMASQDPPVIVDLRHALDVGTTPFRIPGALHMTPEEIMDRHEELPRNRDIVTYCS